MVGVVDIIGLLLILFVNTAIAALATRFFRVRLDTQWGSAIYVVLLIPVALLAVTMVVSGAFGVGPNLGSPMAVIGVTVVVPMTLGVTFDYVWMPSPEEVDLPEQRDQRQRVRRN
jgi:apolipoprotein N-acyltransferase